MIDTIVIGNRPCGIEKIPVTVKYNKKFRQSVLLGICSVDITLFDGNNINKNWCLRLIVPFKQYGSMIFVTVLEKIIRNVFITDSVLSSIGDLSL